MKAAKRGAVETAALVGLLSILFLGFILFVFIKNSALVKNEVTAKETCKRSVEQYAKLKLPGIDLTATDTIKCPTESIQINSNDEEAAKKQIAKAMFNCFDQFGAGELELFDTRRGSKDNYCVVCSKLTFTNIEKGITGLAEYLTTTTIPGRKLTYFEFLQGGKTSAKEAETVTVVDDTNKNGVIDNNDRINKKITLKDITDVVDTSKNYAVLFAYAKATGWWDKISAGTIAGTSGIIVGGAVAGFFTGGVGWVVAAAALTGGASTTFAVAKAPYLDSEWDAGVLLIPYDENIKESLKKANTECGEIPIKQ